MDFTKLKYNHRYLFYQKNRDSSIKYFRANYLEIFVWKEYKTLIIWKYQDEDSKINNSIHYITGTHNIISAKSLIDIIDEKRCKLNDDVLNEINSFY